MGHARLAQIAHTLRPSANSVAEPTASDHDLLGQFVRNHDGEAFRQLVVRHGKLVRAACRQVLSDPADIDDAFQATFLVLLKKAKTFDRTVPLGRWLFAVAHRVAVRCRADARRRMDRESQAAQQASQTTEPPDLSWREAAAVLHEELNALPEKYRLPLLLCCVQGLTRDEAAEQLGTTVGAIRGHLERGRALLEKRLTKRGVVLSVGLLALMVDNSRATGGPSTELIDLTMRAVGDAPNQVVATLARGAFPMTTKLSHSILAVGLVLGMIGVAAIGAGPDSMPVAAEPRNPTPENAQKASSAAKEPILTGSVVDPDGKPVAGAVVWLCHSGDAISPKLPAPKRAATTDIDGQFTINQTQADGRPLWSVIAATKEGYGPGIGTGTADPKDKSVFRCSLRLVKDDVPIRGRIIDLQGKSVAGARVRPIAVHCPETNLDAWERAARSGTKEVLGNHRKVFPNSLRLREGSVDGISGEVTTDQNGRFTLTGIGQDRLVTLRVSGAGVATGDYQTVTRTMATIRTPEDKPAVGFTSQTYYGAEFDLVVGPSQPFVGVVTDKVTGKPVHNVVVRSLTSSRDDSLGTMTDANGHYELAGLSTGEQELIAIPPADTPYYLRTFKAGRQANLQPVVANVELYRGVWVSGTVKDKLTGKPVAASISYRPYTFDSTEDEIPGYVPRGLHDIFWYGTDKDGRFRVLAVPGKGYVFIRAYERYLTADQVDWQGDVEKTDPEPEATSSPVEIASNWNAIGMVTVKDGKPVKEYAFHVDPGETLRARIVDLDGKPVSGAFVTQRRNFSRSEIGQLDGPEVEFERVSPKHPRLTLILHPDKHVGLLFSTKPATVMPTEIQLKPTATVRGRLLTEEGEPRPHTPVIIRYSFTDDGGRRATSLFPEVKTDADGRFTIPNLIEGVWYELQWSLPTMKGVVGYHKVTVKSGEKKDLGDVKP